MELEVYKKSDFYEDYISSQKEYYERENADAYFAERLAEKDLEIAELKKKLMPCLNGDCILTCEVVEKYGKENAELKAKLENVQASAYAESVDAGMRERRLRRALYKACANWADVEVFARTVGIDDPNVEANRWALMRNKCLKKAEEYK